MLALYEESFSPSLDMALSHALLRMVSDGELGESLRLYRPDSAVAFGKRDRVTNGFARAVESAGDAGYDSIIRLAGGRAAVLHNDTIAFAWTIPAGMSRDGIGKRFARLAELLVDAFLGLGVDARIGEVRGEYCPGEFSINTGGHSKVMGVGQRLIAGAAHVGGVIVVDGAKRIAEVLVPVYRDLDLDWDPTTSGDLVSVSPGITWQEVRDAVLGSFERMTDIERRAIPETVLRQARLLEPQHRL
ncbi:MAG: lipoate--protein ligase family protein [Acidimicrobiia bacterium]|nr:lipoate--protein ligase family protein [Acidimicrobiia bacterium]